MSTAHHYLPQFAMPEPMAVRRADRLQHAGRAIVILAFAAATIAGFTLASTSEAAHAASLAGADLTRLLRAMAAIKGVVAMATAAAIVWRLGAPVGTIRLAAYTLGCAAMAAGPGLIWSMDHIGLGALLLHGGLAACIVVLWRDPAMAELLAAKIRIRLGGPCRSPQTPRR